MKTIVYTVSFVIALVGYYVMPIDAKCQISGCPCGLFCVDAKNQWCNSKSSANCVCKRGCMHYERFMLPLAKEDIHCNSCSCSQGSETGHPRCTRRASCGVENLTPGVDFHTL